MKSDLKKSQICPISVQCDPLCGTHWPPAVPPDPSVSSLDLEVDSGQYLVGSSIKAHPQVADEDLNCESLTVLFLGASIVCVNNLKMTADWVLWFPDSDKTSVCTHHWHQNMFVLTVQLNFTRVKLNATVIGLTYFWVSCHVTVFDLLPGQIGSPSLIWDFFVLATDMKTSVISEFMRNKKPNYAINYAFFH